MPKAWKSITKKWVIIKTIKPWFCITFAWPLSLLLFALLAGLLISPANSIESSQIFPYINVASSPPTRLSSYTTSTVSGSFASLLPSSHSYLQYASDPAFFAAAHHYSAAAAAAAAAAAVAQVTSNSSGFIFYPSPDHPLTLSALLAAERFDTKNSSIADLRMKAQKHAAALGI